MLNKNWCFVTFLEKMELVQYILKKVKFSIDIIIVELCAYINCELLFKKKKYI